MHYLDDLNCNYISSTWAFLTLTYVILHCLTVTEGCIPTVTFDF